MVKSRYLCSAPRPETWDVRAEALLKSLGGVSEKSEAILRETLESLKVMHADKQKTGPGRKSNAEHAIAFYEYVLETITESKEEDGSVSDTKEDEEAPAAVADPSVPVKRKRGRPPKNKAAEPPAKKPHVVVDTTGAASLPAIGTPTSHDDTSISIESMDTQEFINQHNDLCEVCSKGGELLMCSTCNLVFHLQCVRPKLDEVPPDSWVCAYCVMSGMKGLKLNSKMRKNAAVAVRLMARMRKQLQRERKKRQEEADEESSSSDDDDDNNEENKKSQHNDAEEEADSKPESVVIKAEEAATEEAGETDKTEEKEEEKDEEEMEQAQEEDAATTEDAESKKEEEAPKEESPSPKKRRGRPPKKKKPAPVKEVEPEPAASSAEEEEPTEEPNEEEPKEEEPKKETNKEETNKETKKEQEEPDSTKTEEEPPEPSPPKKRRGRPPKKKPAEVKAEEAAEEETEVDGNEAEGKEPEALEATKKQPSEEEKKEASEAAKKEADAVEPSPPKRKRGRPPKKKPAEVIPDTTNGPEAAVAAAAAADGKEGEENLPDADEATKEEEAPPVASPPKRRRGRPPKAKKIKEEVTDVKDQEISVKGEKPAAEDTKLEEVGRDDGDAKLPAKTEKESSDGKKGEEFKGTNEGDTETTKPESTQLSEAGSDKTPTRKNIDATTNTSNASLDDSGGGRYIRRNRKKATYYDPQSGAASHWQSDGANEWKFLGAQENTGSDDEIDDGSVDGEGEEAKGDEKEANEDEKKKKGGEADAEAEPSGTEGAQVAISPRKAKIAGAGGSPWCNFCKDDPSILVCCFCACRVCFGKHEPSKLLLCDRCDDEYHTFCLQPALKSVPSSGWFCPTCIAAEKTADTKLGTRGSKSPSKEKAIRTSGRKSVSPSKPKDSAASQPVAPPVKRGPGRPRKHPLPEPQADPAAPRKRGRPPKNKSSPEPSISPPKKRGRPRKNPLPEETTKSSKKRSSPSPEPIVKRGPGRPPKSDRGPGRPPKSGRGPGRPPKSDRGPGRPPKSGRGPGRPPKSENARKRSKSPAPKKTVEKSEDAKPRPKPSTAKDDSATIPEAVKQPAPVKVSRSGRMVKRTSFHDEIDEGEQHLKSTRYAENKRKRSERSSSETASEVASEEEVDQHEIQEVVEAAEGHSHVEASHGAGELYHTGEGHHDIHLHHVDPHGLDMQMHDVHVDHQFLANMPDVSDMGHLVTLDDNFIVPAVHGEPMDVHIDVEPTNVLQEPFSPVPAPVAEAKKPAAIPAPVAPVLHVEMTEERKIAAPAIASPPVANTAASPPEAPVGSMVANPMDLPVAAAAAAPEAMVAADAATAVAAPEAMVVDAAAAPEAMVAAAAAAAAAPEVMVAAAAAAAAAVAPEAMAAVAAAASAPVPMVAAATAPAPPVFEQVHETPNPWVSPPAQPVASLPSQLDEGAATSTVTASIPNPLKAPPPAVASLATDPKGNTQGQPAKVPRRKPGARECMQISRRFGVNVIPDKWMDILLDYCKRGKVEHLIRMRERLDEHSRFLESQLAGLEALVLERGELDCVVPAMPEGENEGGE